MNENRDSNGHADGDDRTLGAEVGAAIGRRSESLGRIPPVADVIERAAAAARARRFRYTLVGVTAAAALIVGGLVAWSTLGRNGDGSVQVATQPSVSERAEPAGPDPSMRTPTPPTSDAVSERVEPAGPEPAPSDSTDAPEAGESDPDTGAPDPVAALSAESGEEGMTADEQSEDPAVADPDDGAKDADSASAGPDSNLPTPEELSTGPTLTWREMDPCTSSDLCGVTDMESVGDGRILARAQGDGGNRILVTDDGTTWFPVGMPAGITLGNVDISGDRWLVAGVNTTGLERVNRAFFSEDEGATWTELAIAVTSAASMPSYCRESSFVESIMASGDRIVLLLGSYTQLDPRALLIERGLATDMDTISSGSHTDSTLVFYLGGPSNPERVEVTRDDLGLAPWQPPCAGPDGVHSRHIRILAGDGIDTEQVAEYTGLVKSAVGTPDGFSIIMLTDEGTLLLTSSDGRRWNEIRLADNSRANIAHDTDGTIWQASRGDGPLTIQRSRFGEALTTAATFDGLQPAGVLTAGPAGVVATAWLEPDGYYRAINKGGYELRIDGFVPRWTLWDPTEDAALYELGPESLQGGDYPEGVRRIAEDDGSTTVVFEDPDTGDDLVAFTIQDLFSLRTTDTSERFEEPRKWIGWSADGTDWGWQDAAEVFSIDTAEDDPWVETSTFAVGEDFVLARVALLRSSVVFGGYSEGQLPTPWDVSVRWFIASVP